MSRQPARCAAPPQIIYVIRHGQKPADLQPAAPGRSPASPGPPFGVDGQGNQDGPDRAPGSSPRYGAISASVSGSMAASLAS